MVCVLRFCFFFSSLGQHGEEERAELGLGKLAQDHLELAIEVNYYANNYFWLHYSSREALSLDFGSVLFVFVIFRVRVEPVCACAPRDREIKMSPWSIPIWPTRHQAEKLVDVDSCFENLKGFVYL